MEVVVLVGLQASGKSTFFRMTYAATHDWVSLDRMRNNRKPRRRQATLIAEALRAGRSVVVDNTNPSVADRAPILELARLHGAETRAVWLDASLADCLTRNRERSGRDRVPDVALYATVGRIELPTRAEGFDRVLRATIAEAGGFVVEEMGETGR